METKRQACGTWLSPRKQSDIDGAEGPSSPSEPQNDSPIELYRGLSLGPSTIESEAGTFSRFAFLPFELRHMIWKQAMESEPAVLHSLVIYSVYNYQEVTHKPGHGVLTFSNLEAADTSPRPLDPFGPKHFLQRWGQVNRLASDQGLWSVCPESRKVVSKNDKSWAIGTYTSETGETETIVMKLDKDLFYFVLNFLGTPNDPAMENMRGVGHIAFRASQSWYGRLHDMLQQHADAWPPDFRDLRDWPRTLRVFLDGVLDGERQHNTIHWAEHVWLVDYELKRVEGSSSVDIKNRHVFVGNGCRLVEVRETDDAVWDFHWGYKQACKPGYRGRRKPNADDVTIFDFFNKLGISAGSERGLTRLTRRPGLRLPKVGVLAFERLS